MDKYNKHRVIKLITLKNIISEYDRIYNIFDTNDYLDTIIDMHIKLNNEQLKNKIIQAWVVDINNNFNVIPYFYIKTEYRNKEQFIGIDVNGKIYISKQRYTWIYKKRPSYKKLSKMINFKY